MERTPRRRRATYRDGVRRGAGSGARAGLVALAALLLGACAPDADAGSTRGDAAPVATAQVDAAQVDAAGDAALLVQRPVAMWFWAPG
ncbi:MAG: hypothetical protein RL283_1425 [Actinomycetota bacterium]